MSSFKDFRTQMLGMGVLGSMSESTSMGSMVSGMIFMQVIDIMNTHLPTVMGMVKNYVENRFNKKIRDIADQAVKNKITANIIYTYSPETVGDDTVSGLINHLSNNNPTKFIRYAKDYKPVNIDQEGFTVGFKDIKCRVKKIGVSETGKIDNIEFELFSTTLLLEDIHLWVESVTEKYKKKKRDKIGRNKYLFLEKHQPLPINSMNGGAVQYECLPPHLKFTMNKFTTTKKFSNIYGENIQKIKERIDLFENNHEWYERTGTPRKLGILLHGVAGSGKTSIIKALSEKLDRNIISFKLTENTTQQQLNNLFHGEDLYVEHGVDMEKFQIPVEKRLYVIEEIDCVSSIVANRNKKEPEDQIGTAIQELEGIDAKPWSKAPPVYGNNIGVNYKQSDKGAGIVIDMGYLLDLLDGILEDPGRIIIMTTNHPEILDPALTRAGRIDLEIHFQNATAYMIREMLNNFFPKNSFKEFWESDNELVSNLDKYDKLLTPAVIAECFSKFYKNPEEAMEELYIKFNEEIERLEIERQSVLLKPNIIHKQFLYAFPRDRNPNFYRKTTLNFDYATVTQYILEEIFDTFTDPKDCYSMILVNGKVQDQELPDLEPDSDQKDSRANVDERDSQQQDDSLQQEDEEEYQISNNAISELSFIECEHDFQQKEDSLQKDDEECQEEDIDKERLKSLEQWEKYAQKISQDGPMCDRIFNELVEKEKQKEKETNPDRLELSEEEKKELLSKVPEHYFKPFSL